MTERLQPSNLTNRGQNPYPKGGDIFMSEPGQGDLPPRPEDTQQQPQQPPETSVTSPQPEQNPAREAWKSYYESQGLDIEKLGVNERGVIDMAIAVGNIPGNRPLEEVLEHFRRVDTENGNPSGESSLPASGGEGGGRPPRRPTAGGGGGGEPPEEPPTATGGEGGEPPIPPRTPDNERGINFNKEGIINETIIKDIRQAEAGYDQSTSLDEQLGALRNTYQKIIAEELPEGQENQRNLGLIALQAKIDELVAEKQSQIGEARLSREQTEKERNFIKITASEIVEGITQADNDTQRMDLIEKFIDDLDPNGREYPHIINEIVDELKENREWDPLIEDMLEYSLETFLNRADEQPTEDYPQFTLGEGENISGIAQIGRRFDWTRKSAFKNEVLGDGEERKELGHIPGRKEMFKYLTSLKSRRQVMHELFKSMNDAESFIGGVTRGLRSSGMLFVEKELAGVSHVQIVYEQVLLSMKSLKLEEEGWLSEDDFKKGDATVHGLLDDSMRNNSDVFNKEFIGSDGNLTSRPLREWEISRAFHMGRDLSGASLRRVVLGIIGDVPKNADSALKSVVHEPIARRLAPLKLLPDRFFGQRIAKYLIEKLKHEQRRNAKGEIDYGRYGYVVKVLKNGHWEEKIDKKQPDKERQKVTRGFFGSSQGAMSIMDLKIVDLKTSSWRGRLMFLKNPRFKTAKLIENPNNPDDPRNFKTIGEYLDATKKKYTKELDKLNLKGRKKHDKNIELMKQWNKEIGDTVFSQRLFLGALVRYPFGDEQEGGEQNKAQIWANAAAFLPSRIASLFPNETLALMGMREEGEEVEGRTVSEQEARETRENAIARWAGTDDNPGIVQKLWLAERMRVANDAKALSGQGGKPKRLSEFFDTVGLKDPSDLEIVRKLQSLDLGRGYESTEYAGILAHAEFPFTAFFDDAPESDWEQLSDFDFTRILVSDHSAQAEGYGNIMGILDNPVKKIEDVNKILFDAFEKAKGPPGIPDEQKVFAPIIRATYGMRQMSNSAKWMGESLTRAARIPTSPTEEFNLSAGVGDDEPDTARGLGGLAQMGLVSDDPNERDENGRTPFEVMRRDLDADRKKVLLAYFRLMMQIFGPVLAMEFAKALGIKV